MTPLTTQLWDCCTVSIAPGWLCTELIRHSVYETVNGLPGLSNWAGCWKWKVNRVNWLKSRSRWDLFINYHTKVTDNHPAFKPLGVKWLNLPLLLITWTEIRGKHTVIHFYWAFLESGTKGGWIGQSGHRVKFGTVPQKTGRLAAMELCTGTERASMIDSPHPVAASADVNNPSGLP